MTSELRPDLPSVSGWARTRRSLVVLAVLVVLGGGLTPLDVVLGWSSSPVDNVLQFAVFGIVMMVVVPSVEYRMFCWKARRKVRAVSLEPRTVVPCGVVEWFDGRGRCLPGGLQIPDDASPPKWWPLTDTDQRQLILSPQIVRLAGFRSPERQERWGIGWTRLVIVVLVSNSEEETHLCLTMRDAHSVAARYEKRA